MKLEYGEHEVRRYSDNNIPQARQTHRMYKLWWRDTKNAHVIRNAAVVHVFGNLVIRDYCQSYCKEKIHSINEQWENNMNDNKSIFKKNYQSNSYHSVNGLRLKKMKKKTIIQCTLEEKY